MPSRLATSLTVKLCGGNSFFNTVSFLSGEYRVTHSSLALCSINDDLMKVTTSLTQGGSKPLEFAKGKNAIELTSEAEVADTLRKVREAAELGELDTLIEQQAQFGR